MKDINKLLEEKGNYEFGVNSWGSCQYSGALAMFNAYFVLREKYDQDVLFEYLNYEYGYIISYDGIYTDDEAQINYFNKWKERWDWKFDIDLNPYEEYEKIDKSEREMVSCLRRVKSGDDMFFSGRVHALDLWHTAPKVAKSYFKNLKIENVPNCDKPTGLEKGPVGNICAQSDNILTGLCCALLWDQGIVKNPNSFKGFDT